MQLRLLRSQRFAPSSEQHYQAWLFDEAEQAARETPPPPATPVAAHARAKPGRKPLPAELPCVAEVQPLPSHSCTCGEPLTTIEPIRSEQVDVIPAQVFVREDVRERGVCRAYNTPPVVAPLPPQPIPKSLASPGLLAFIGVSKHADGIPLYRQSAMHARMNIDLPRHTAPWRATRWSEASR